MADDKPMIEVSVSRLMCPGHGEHLAEHWPRGFAHAAMMILRAALESPDLHDAIERMGGRGPGGLNPQYINLITVKMPFCYFVDRDVIRNALSGSDIGVIGNCHVCFRSGMGGPYRLADIRGEIHKLEHVCFECALTTGENMHRAYPKGNKSWHKES